MLKDKIIVVTGGNGLLGRELVGYIRGQRGIPVVADIDVKNENDGALKLDITDENSISECIAEILKRHKRIDGWVNNAYPRTKDWGCRFENIKAESWRKNVDMHLNGYFMCSKAVLEIMKKQHCGSLVSMASIYGMVGPDFSVYDGTSMTMPAAYSAIKGGIINLTRYMASYFGEYNVRVNSVAPGGIFDNQPESFVARYSRKVPLKRMGLPKDIAPAVAFLLSDGAGYITGHNLVVDGGWSII